ncbi:DCLRE1A [Mytilus coruscus]|uniref:DCLRE1A n=1 Tax=Mytilus coruscus TaxID=42192 RepID=A0A6J8EC59_MYTCO|nr:DCLRE1A [Mytilus coruscus]
MDEEDFEYIPLMKKKKKNLVIEDKKKKEENTKKLSRNQKGDKNKAQNKVESTPSKSQGTTRHKRKTPKSKTPKRERKKYDGYCPACQMPFSALVIETPTWHASECMDNYKPESECSEGADCDCTIQSHFWRFSHKQLAEYRQRKTRADQIDKQKKGKARLNFDESKTSPETDFELIRKCKSSSLSIENKSVSSQIVTNNTSINSQVVINICSPSKPRSSQGDTEDNVAVTNNTSSNSPVAMNICSSSNFSHHQATLSIMLQSQTIPQKSENDLITCDERLESLEQCEHDMQTSGSQNVKSEKEKQIGVSCGDEDSCLSQPLFEDDENEIVQSGKSVSDIDASEDSNSQSKSFFANYRRRMESLENTSSNDSEKSQKFLQQSCKKEYKIVNSELTCPNSEKPEIEGNEFADKHPSDLEFSSNELTSKLSSDTDLCSIEQKDKHLNDLVILDADDTDSDVQYISTCDIKKSDSVPSSQGSINSATKTRTKGGKKSKVVNVVGSNKKSKLSKQQSDMKNQPSLLSFFSGSKTNKGLKDKTKTNASNNDIQIVLSILWY